MISLLIAIIYMAFVSLGLPDSLLGSCWHILQEDFHVPSAYMGIIAVTITFGTIVSSLFSNLLTKKIGSGLVTAISVGTTAVALLGFSLSSRFWHLVLWAIPYGLGAGAVDATLNNYVALHYSSKHMNWLHACWGLGALISPFIMGASLQGGFDWNGGYGIVSVIQVALSIALFFSLPLWKNTQQEQQQQETASAKDALKIKGAWLVLFMFFAYCSLEQTAMLWASTYLANARNVDSILATEFGSLCFIGITAGRFVCGFFANKIGDNKLIFAGICVILVGILLIILPLPVIFAFVGLVIIGIGCAPIYPAIIHSTPQNFGEKNSQALVGLQMAFAYTGCLTMPNLFGLFSEKYLSLYPYFLAFLLVVMIVMFVSLNKTVAKNKKLAMQKGDNVATENI